MAFRFVLIRLLCAQLGASSWPPENPCAKLAGINCSGDCEMNCNSSGLTYWRDTCWPIRGQGWSCDYYGGRYFCEENKAWSCQSGFGLASGKGCHCWRGYRGYAKCCPCPEVENCAGPEYISCSSVRQAWGTGNLTHLHAPHCSLCKSGFRSFNGSCLQ